MPMTAAVLIVACTLWHECRGEPAEGQRAVASVIANRARARHTTPDAECLRAWQFSCWNGGRTLADMLPGRAKRRTPAWLRCLTLAGDVCGDGFESTGPWDHYCRWDCWPGWRRAAEREDRIGSHVFMVVK